VYEGPTTYSVTTSFNKLAWVDGLASDVIALKVYGILPYAVPYAYNQLRNVTYVPVLPRLGVQTVKGMRLRSRSCCMQEAPLGLWLRR
jgi:hypothetical protein